MIELKEISKIYRSKKSVDTTALKNVSLTLADKGMVFILGKSGSGKSTLLNLLGGLDKPSSGEIFIQGKSMKDFTERDLDGYRNSFVGFVFQEFNLLEDYNVYENIELALALQQKEDENHLISQLLTSLDLEGLEKRRINELSGGQKQRVAIARALVKQPKLLLCDEPTGNLDQKSGQEIFNILKEISQQNLVVVVSHDEESARKYADRILTIVDGEILSDTGEQWQSENKGSFTLQDAHIPFSYIFRMALHNLKLKPFKLVITVLLLIFSLILMNYTLNILFMNADDLAFEAITRNQHYIFEIYKMKYEQATDFYGYTLYSADSQTIDEEDLAYLKTIANTTYHKGYFIYDSYQNINFSYGEADTYYTKLNVYPNITAFIELEDDTVFEHLMGRSPRASNELVISEYLADYMIAYGVYDTENELYKPESRDQLIRDHHPLKLQNETVYIVGIATSDRYLEAYQNGYYTPDTQKWKNTNYLQMYVYCRGFTSKFMNRDLKTLLVYEPDEKKIKQLIDQVNVLNNITNFNTIDVSPYLLINEYSDDVQDITYTYHYTRIFYLILTIIFVLFTFILFIHLISSTIQASQKKINILRSLGTSKQSLFKIFALETGVIALVAFVGSLIGWSIAIQYFNQKNIEKIFLEVPSILFEPITVIISLFFTVVVSLLVTKITVKKISRL